MIAGGIRGDQEGGDPLVLLRRVDGGEDQGDVGMGAVGDEDLGAVQHPVVAVAAGGGAEARGVAARSRLGEGEAAELLARGERGQNLPLLLLVAELHDGIADQRVVHRQDDARGGADPADLLDDQAVGDVVHAGAAVLLGDGHPGEAELARLVEEGARELPALVDLLGPRFDHLFGEAPDLVADLPVLVAELDAHVSPLGFLSGWGRDLAEPAAPPAGS